MARTTSLLLLLAAIFVAYAPVRHAEFLNYDDNEYVTANPPVEKGLSPDSMRWAFTQTHSANWHPVTWISHMADVEFLGGTPADAGSHHLMNVFVHALASIALAWLGFALTGSWWASLLVAALFGLHPAHVESVAWISERKDTLSALFGFLTLLAFVNRVRKRTRLWWWLTTLLFAIGLMAKPMLVTLPVAMMLLEFWPLRRTITLRASLVEKLPWFAMAAASAAITLVAQSEGAAVKSVQLIPISDRIVNALHSNFLYLGKLGFPARLSVIYPHWSTSPFLEGPAPWVTALEIAGLAGISAGVVFLWRRRDQRAPLMAWALWLLLLLPVIGILQVGDQAMADRYTYLPSLGPFLLLAVGLSLLARRSALSRVVAIGLSVLIVSAAGARTWQQAAVWQDSETLFRNAVALEPMSPTAHLNLGQALSKRGDAAGAARQYAESIRLEPADADAHFNLGNILRDDDDLDGAIKEYQSALRLNPEHFAAANNLGDAFARRGLFEKAIRWFRVAAKDPGLSAARVNLGRALIATGREAESIPIWETLSTERPDDPDIWTSLARAALMEDTDRASRAAEHAVQLSGRRDGSALELLARAQGLQGKQTLALSTMREAGQAYRTAGKDRDADRIAATLEQLSSPGGNGP